MASLELAASASAVVFGSERKGEKQFCTQFSSTQSRHIINISETQRRETDLWS